MSWILLARSASASDERVHDWASRLFRLGYPSPVNLEKLPPRAILANWAQLDPYKYQVFLPPYYLLPLHIEHRQDNYGKLLDAVLLDRRTRLLYVTEKTTLEFDWADRAAYRKIKDRNQWRPAGNDRADARSFRPRSVNELPDPYGLGTRRPQVWILGEESNPRSLTHPLPLVSVSGLSMVWSHVDPWRDRVSNVLPPHGATSPALVEQDWKLMGCPQVIVLGKIALHIVQRTAIEPWSYLDHPQFVWRFHHAAVPRWEHELERCLNEIHNLYATVEDRVGVDAQA